MGKGSRGQTRKCNILDTKKLHKALKTFFPPVHLDKPVCVYVYEIISEKYKKSVFQQG